MEVGRAEAFILAESIFKKEMIDWGDVWMKYSLPGDGRADS